MQSRMPEVPPGKISDYGNLFDADYYKNRFGPISYERNEHWLDFFAGIARQLVRSLKPGRVFDAGCAWGFLVEAFWDLGVEAEGVDISEHAIANVRPDMRPYCTAGSLITPLARRYDLITCIEVLEHMPAAEADQAMANLCESTDTILFSSTPRDFEEPTHINVRPVSAWLQGFRDNGFGPDLLYDASFVAPHAFLVRRRPTPVSDDVLALFNEKTQCRVSLVEKLKETFAAAEDIQNLRNTNEELSREAARARELQVSIEEWVLHDAELSRELQRVRDEGAVQLDTAARNLNDLSKQLEHARYELNDVSARLERENSTLLHELHEAWARRDEVERMYQHLNAEYSSPAWQLIRRYRRFMDNARRHAVVRKVVEPAVLGALRMAGAAPKPAPAGPALPAPRATEPTRASAGVTGTAPMSAADSAYAAWIQENEPDDQALAIQSRISAGFTFRPTISIVVPVYKVPLDVLKELVISVQTQTYDNWELCFSHSVPDATDVRQYLQELASSDPRIKVVALSENQGISANSNAALAPASGEYIALLDHDDTLAPFALFEVVKALNEDRSIDFLYSDKDQLSVEGSVSRRLTPLFKPQWSPEIMLSANYLTHFCVMKAEHVRAVGGWRSETDGAQDWDLFLRVISRGPRVRHIPRVLYHWRQIATSVAARGFDAKPYAARAQLTTLRDYCQLQGWDVELQEPGPNENIRINWKPHASKVSVVLLSSASPSDALAQAKRLLNGIENVPVEVILPMPGSLASDDPRVRTVETSGAAGVADRVTAAVKASGGELLVFMGESVTPSNPDWLSQLVGPLQITGVGVVGAKLLDPRSESVVHAGLLFREDGRLQYIFTAEPENYHGSFGGPGWYRNWSAVSGACMAMRRQTWDQIGGLSGTIWYPRLDVELCLRAQFQLGMRVVYTPQARLFQTSPSPMEAWLAPDAEERAARSIAAAFPFGDPYFNPNLSCDKGAVRLGRERKSIAAHDYASEARALASAFDFTQAQVQESKRQTQRPGQRKMENITWLLPDFATPFYGGIHTVLRFADQFQERHDVRSRFVIYGHGHPAGLRDRIGEAFPQLAAESEVLVTASDAILADLADCDAAVATLWTTAYSLLRFRNTRRKFYFIQDYEPLFYPAGSTSALVEATYDFGFTGICNTVALKQIYEERGGRAEHFDPCIDPSTFHSRNRSATSTQPALVFCYARPGHPRNCFELLMAAMRILKQRLGDRVSIVTAGAGWAPASFGLEGIIRNLGLLGYRETGALYRACDAGVVAMKTRHPSYLPLELMACGSAVVTNRNPYTGWLLRDGENCLLAETSASGIAEAIEQVLGNRELRARLAQCGAATASAYSNWPDQAEKIFQFMVAEC